ncbi:sunset domain-containing protein [Limosilactobacillus reuteri]
MRKLATIFTSFFAGICLFIIPINQHSVLASDLPLTVNIPDGKNAQATSKGIKIDTEADGSITFSGKTEANAAIKIVKHGGNNGRYTVEADDKSAKTSFTVTNTTYVKPVVESESSSSSSEESSAVNTSSSSTAPSNNGDMRTDQAGMIVGNARSKIYHTPDQQGYHMNSANAVYFNSEAEAQAAGYRKSLR